MDRPFLTLWTGARAERNRQARSFIPGATCAAGYAYRLLDQTDEPVSVGAWPLWTFSVHTAELHAVRAGLEQVPPHAAVRIYSGSQHVADRLAQLADPAFKLRAGAAHVSAQLRLIQDLIISRALKVEVVKVPASLGVSALRECDDAARQALKTLNDQPGAGVHAQEALESSPERLSPELPTLSRELIDQVATALRVPPAKPVVAPAEVLAAPVSPSPALTGQAAAAGETELHFSASGLHWTARVGIKHLSGSSRAPDQALLDASITALHAVPDGFTVRCFTPSLNHALWLKGEQKARAPKITRWLNRVRRIVRSKNLVLA